MTSLIKDIYSSIFTHIDFSIGEQMALIGCDDCKERKEEDPLSTWACAITETRKCDNPRCKKIICAVANRDTEEFYNDLVKGTYTSHPYRQWFCYNCGRDAVNSFVEFKREKFYPNKRRRISADPPQEEEMPPLEPFIPEVLEPLYEPFVVRKLRNGKEFAGCEKNKSVLPHVFVY